MHRIAGWLSLALMGCASLPPPSAELTQAQSAVSAAEQMHAASYGRSAARLRTAEQELNTAHALIAAGRMHRARRLLERAKADAELAAIFAQADKTMLDAEALGRQATIIEQR